MTSPKKPATGVTGAKITSKPGPPPGWVRTVARVACAVCGKSSRRHMIVGDLEREGNRLDLSQNPVATQKERLRLQRALDYARTKGDSAAVAEAEQRVADHQAKLREKTGSYFYTFDLREDQTGKTYALRCRKHGVVVVDGLQLVAAAHRHGSSGRSQPLVVHADRPHSA